MCDIEILIESLIVKKHNLTIKIEKMFHAQQLSHMEISVLHTLSTELLAVSSSLEHIEAL